MQFIDPNKGEFPEVDEAKTDEESQDSTNVSHEGPEGEGLLLPLHDDAAAGEQNGDVCLIGSRNTERVVSQLKMSRWILCSKNKK